MNALKCTSFLFPPFLCLCRALKGQEPHTVTPPELWRQNSRVLAPSAYPKASLPSPALTPSALRPASSRWPRTPGCWALLPSAPTPAPGRAHLGKGLPSHNLARTPFRHQEHAVHRLQGLTQSSSRLLSTPPGTQTEQEGGPSPRPPPSPPLLV